MDHFLAGALGPFLTSPLPHMWQLHICFFPGLPDMKLLSSSSDVVIFLDTFLNGRWAGICIGKEEMFRSLKVAASVGLVMVM